MKSLFASLAFCLLLSTAVPANERPSPLSPTYTTAPPPGYLFGAPAFDGDWMVVYGAAINTAPPDGEYSPTTTAAVFLYRRGGLGPWLLQRKLLEFPFYPDWNSTGLSFAMENALLAVEFAGKLYIYERSSAGYTQSAVLDQGFDSYSLRIDGKRILAGLGTCDGAAVVEKNAAGSWAISGRLATTGTDCRDELSYTDDLDFSGDYALVATRSAGRPTQAFRRNASGWTKTADIVGLNEHFLDTAVALRGNLAMLAGNLNEGTRVLRRADASGATWDPVTTLRTVDSFVGWNGHVGSIRQRNELWMLDHDLWRQKPDNTFKYLARLESGHDASGRTVVGYQLDGNIATYILPETIPDPPASLRDDFEGSGNIEWDLGYGFTFARSGFTRVLRQSQSTSLTEAIATASDWSNQSIQLDVRPTAIDNSAGFIGLTTRRSDAGDYYRARFHQDRVTLVRRKQGGLDVQLATAAIPFTAARNYRLRFEARGRQLLVFVDGAQILAVEDGELARGKAGVATYFAKADFDDLVVSPVATPLFDPDDMRDTEKWTVSGGAWVGSTNGSTPYKRSQTDRTVAARSLTGVPDTDDQVIETVVRIDSLPPSGDRWVGVLARYRDNANLYYVSLRVGTGVQIRRVVNGAATVLATVPYTVKGNTDYRLRFEAVGDELRVFVDDVFLAEAHDAALATGRFGVATNLAAASFSGFNAFQP